MGNTVGLYTDIINHLIVFLDDVHDVAAIATQSAMTAAFNLLNKLYISSVCLNLTALWYSKDKVHLLVSNGAMNLVD